MNGNYIKVSRSLLDWCWYHDVNTCRLFIHMLLRVNWKKGYFGEEVIERGSFVSSISKLSAETGLSEREVRTALEHLKKTGEVTCNRHAKYSVYTVVNTYLEEPVPFFDDAMAMLRYSIEGERKAKLRHCHEV